MLFDGYNVALYVKDGYLYSVSSAIHGGGKISKRKIYKLKNHSRVRGVSDGIKRYFTNAEVEKLVKIGNISL